MTSNEIVKVLELLETAYGVKKFYADTNKEKVIWLWSVMFRDDDPVEVNRAVINCISTSPYAPAISDIKTRMAEDRMAGQMTEMEAWNLVRKAVINSNSNEEAQKEFDRLPPIIQKVLGDKSPLRSWRKIDDDDFETVTASNFMRSYSTWAKREAGYYAMPEQLQQSQKWRIEAPKQEALPAPEKLKYEKPEWMIRREEKGLPIE